MEEDNYYTPEVKEFYVGFEYERRCIEIKELNTYEDVWEKSKYNTSDYIGNNCNNGIVGDFVRVKYLDKLDIESLGWKAIGFNVFTMEGKDCSITLHDDDNTIGIRVRNSVKVDSILIKNKSELIKLMKQLGI